MEEFSVTKIVLSIILVLGILFGTCWVTGFFGLFYDKTIGVEKVNIQREKFENSASYVKGIESDIAKYKYELATEKDPIARKAIIDLLVDKYIKDIDKIGDESLKSFLDNIRNGRIK